MIKAHSMPMWNCIRRELKDFFVRRDNLKMYMRCQENEIKALWRDNKTRNCIARL